MKNISILIVAITLLLSVETTYSQGGSCFPEDSAIAFTFQGRNYEFVKSHYKWPDAIYCAEQRGGYLVDVETMEENEAFLSFLMDSLKNKYSLDLIGDGDTKVRLGGVGVTKLSNPVSITWQWRNTPYNRFNNILGTQVENKNGTDFKSFPDSLYINWGEINNVKGAYFFPTDYHSNLYSNTMAMTLVEIKDNETNNIVAQPGDWINVNGSEEMYFIIDYGCASKNEVTIDTLLCEGTELIIGGTEITEPGEYTITTTSYAECDSIITANVSFTSFDNQLTQEPKRLLSKELQADSYQWYRCDLNLPIQDANTFFLTIEETGSYRLELEKNGCDFVTECYDFCIPTTFKIDTVKCANESITINGQEYEKKGFYSQKLKQEGFDCDSTLEIDIKDVAMNLSVKQQSGKLVSSESAGEYQWYNCEGDVLIADATQKEFTPKEDGDYKVEITKQGCIDYSQCISFSTSTNSVKDIQDSDNIQLDLNNNLIVFDNINYDQIELLDMNSKTIYKSDKYAQSISIEYLNTGVYFLKVTNGNEVEMFKFLVVE